MIVARYCFCSLKMFDRPSGRLFDQESERDEGKELEQGDDQHDSDKEDDEKRPMRRKGAGRMSDLRFLRK